VNRLNSAISIIVPTLNEADNLPNLFKRINKSLSKSCIPYEIIVVDDRSSDDTVEIAKSYANKYNVRTEIKIGQRGKAFSLIQGFKGAKNSLVCMIDADLQYPPEAIAHMYKLLKSNDGDIVITERFEPQTSRLRQVSSKTFNFVFAKMLFGINYDTQSGLKLFKKEILDKISLNPSPWSFDLEFLVKSIENKYTILNYKIPFNRREYGEPKVHVISTSIELAKASVRLWRETPRKEIKNNYKQNLKVFRGMSVFMDCNNLFRWQSSASSFGYRLNKYRKTRC
jgi:dolichol-phosphate mannosyltransferase